MNFDYVVVDWGSDGGKIAAITVQGKSSVAVCGEAWIYVLQTVAGAEQTVHSGATYRGEMQPVV